jgi:hypothetical protein
MSIESVKAKHEEKLMQLPNVTIAATGEMEGKPVIKIYVTHKVPESKLQSHEVVPKTLDGYDIDVEESGAITAQSP